MTKIQQLPPYKVVKPELADRGFQMSRELKRLHRWPLIPCLVSTRVVVGPRISDEKYFVHAK